MASGSLRIGDKIIEFNVTFTGNLDARTDIQVTSLIRWSLVTPQNHLVIDEQSCQIFSLPEQKHLGLARCLYTGMWMKLCDRLSDDETSCAK
jgi:hypothetical protein